MTLFKATTLGTVVTSLLLLISVSCGEQKATTKVLSKEKVKATVQIPIKFGASSNLALAGSSDGGTLTSFYGIGFNLTSATSYKMDLAGCVSGLTGTNITGASVKVYLSDRSCVMKLTQFVFNGNTYSATATGATNFSSWAAGQSATFANTNNLNVATDKFIVTVGTQLSSPVIAADTVSYNFHQANAGTTQAVANNVVSSGVNGVGQSVSVGGQDAPNFVLSTNGSPVATGAAGTAPVVFLGVNASGTGIFQFNLYCAAGVITGTALTGATPYTCGDVQLQNISYKLQQDNVSGYNVSGAVALTQAQLQTIMASGTSTIAAADVIANNNKGFIAGPGTASPLTGGLAGVGTINANPNYILVVQVSSGGYTAWTYFGIDVNAIANP